MWKEFKEFALRGNVVDLAVGFILGSAFTTIVQSLVNDIIMPPIGLLFGDVDFSNLFWVLKPGEMPGPYSQLSVAQEAGAVTINYGIFINNLISFLIVALVMFFLIRGMNNLYLMRQRGEPIAEEKPTTKPCPYCKETIAIDATRCSHCTSEIST